MASAVPLPEFQQAEMSHGLIEGLSDCMNQPGHTHHERPPLRNPAPLHGASLITSRRATIHDAFTSKKDARMRRGICSKCPNGAFRGQMRGKAPLGKKYFYITHLNNCVFRTNHEQLM